MVHTNYSHFWALTLSFFSSENFGAVLLIYASRGRAFLDVSLLSGTIAFVTVSCQGSSTQPLQLERLQPENAIPTPVRVLSLH